jgi:hypothetical protein
MVIQSKKDKMKSDWIKYFPFKEVRLQQEDALNFAIKEFKAGKRFVCLELPTGVGKSGIAVTLGKYFQAHMQTPGIMAGTYIITPQKILQAQYEKDFADINNVSAKQNYTCPQRPGSVSCQIGQWMNQIALSYSQQNVYNEDCPYKQAKKKFKDGILSLTNVAYMLNNIMYTDEIKVRQLLIVDECHMLESALIDFVAMDFDGNVIEEELGIKWNRVSEHTDITVFTDWVVDTYLPKVNEIVEKTKTKIKSYAMKHGTVFDKAHIRLLNIYSKYDTIGCQVKRYLDHFNKQDWVMSVDEYKQIVKIQPIYASKYAESHLFKVADKILLMSGTILDKKAFCSNLGIAESQSSFLSLDSPFPKENRPIFSMNIGLMSYNNIDSTLPKLTKAVREILNSHSKDKGIIHCVDENSLISTEFGDLKIKDIKPNIKVKTINEINNNFEYKNVNNVYNNGQRECLKLKFKNREIVCTFDHKILTKNRGWVKAIDLTQDDDVISSLLQ